MGDVGGVRALVFDVYGTVVDWRTPVIEAVTTAAAMLGVDGDWEVFTADWKAGYRPPMAAINKGAEWRNVDEIMRARLDEIVGDYGLGGLSATARDELNEAWGRARPWPDSVAGLTRLHEKYLLATLSNCTFRWLVGMARLGGLPFDGIMTSEIAKAYKPAPAIYEMAIEFLGGDPGGLMLVACHNYDLKAARSHGMKTAFLPRQENGPGQTTDQEPEDDWDVVAADLGDLAGKLGC